MDPVKTCGNCWYGPPVKGTTRRCKRPVPMWVMEMLRILEIQGIKMTLNEMFASDTATNCPCWRERWVEGR